MSGFDLEGEEPKKQKALKARVQGVKRDAIWISTPNKNKYIHVSTVFFRLQAERSLFSSKSEVILPHIFKN